MFKRRITGLILLSMGVGMLIVLIFPKLGWFIAFALVIYGFYKLFLC
jgi:hypothetical protein